jgi:hypothetical protein
VCVAVDGLQRRREPLDALANLHAGASQAARVGVVERARGGQVLELALRLVEHRPARKVAVEAVRASWQARSRRPASAASSRRSASST